MGYVVILGVFCDIRPLEKMGFDYFNILQTILEYRLEKCRLTNRLRVQLVLNVLVCLVDSLYKVCVKIQALPLSAFLIILRPAADVRFKPLT